MKKTSVRLDYPLVAPFPFCPTASTPLEQLGYPHEVNLTSYH